VEKHVEDDLLGRYPELFRQSKQNPVGVPYWGVQCEVGWLPLIDRLCSKIQGRINNLESSQVTIVQIKEKDGSLSISHLMAMITFAVSLTWHRSSRIVFVKFVGAQDLKRDCSLAGSRRLARAARRN